MSIARSLVAVAVLAASLGASPQNRANGTFLPPARPDLQAVPLPPLTGLEAAVVEQIRDVNGAFAEVASRTGLTDVELADAYGSLGRLYHAYDFFDSADACYRNAVRLNPDDFRWLHLLGYLHYQQRDLEESVEFYLRALESQPDDEVAMVYLGNLYLWLNRPGEARDRFGAALMTFPVAALSGLGETALAERRFEEAVDHLETALERVPEARRLHYSLGMAYRGLGRLEEAQAHLRQVGPGSVRPIDPLVDDLEDLLRGERVHLVLGRLAFEAQQFGAATDAFRKAVEAAPESVDARINLGSALARLGDTEGAIRELQVALGLDPDDATAHLNLGMVLASENRHAEAVDHFRAVTARAPEDLTARRSLSRSLLRLGREGEAVEVLFTITSLDPGDEDSLLGLVLLLADRERFGEAIDLLDRADRLFPNRDSTKTTLARLLASSPDLELRDGDRALELSMAVYEASPMPVHGETVILSLAESGRCEEAAVWQRRILDDAEREGELELAARLKVARYDQTPCRPESSGR